jgi:CPA2 family monovalent cation:H+ antiporter-2
MHNIDLLVTLTGGLTAALALGFLALKLRLPPIVGYLVAGLLIGPHTPGFVANRVLAEQLAEVGVILLMFGVGLHFHIRDLLAVRRIALTGAFGQIAVSIAIGTAAARSFGWSWPAAALFGTALSVASTVVLTRVLADNGDLHSQTGRIAVGWLIVEDIFTVFVLVILPAVFGGGDISLPVALGLSGLKLAGLTALTLGAGGHLIPRLLSSIARTHSRELFTLTILVVALGIAVTAAKVFGVSVAMGAFLAGMVVGQSEFSYRAASEALPMRDAFAVLFSSRWGCFSIPPTSSMRRFKSW